jgi:hypothetical protein
MSNKTFGGVKMSWRGWVVFIVAVWLIIGAFISGFTGNGQVVTNNTQSATSTNVASGNGNYLFSLTNFVIVGIIFATMGIFMFASSKAAAWITLLSGIWLIIAAFIPAITKSGSLSLTNGLIFGILTLTFSFFDRKTA